MMKRFLDWFYATRHAMCATDTVWSRVANMYTVECVCCSFWRGMLIGGFAGALCAVMAVLAIV